MYPRAYDAECSTGDMVRPNTGTAKQCLAGYEQRLPGSPSHGSGGGHSPGGKAYFSSSTPALMQTSSIASPSESLDHHTTSTLTPVNIHSQALLLVSAIIPVTHCLPKYAHMRVQALDIAFQTMDRVERAFQPMCTFAYLGHLLQALVECAKFYD